MHFENKVIVLTGAAAGIGKAVAQAFAREGATLSLCDIDLDKLKATAADLNLPDDRLALHKVDVGDRHDVERLISDTVECFGRLDILVNNAGMGAFGYVTEVEPEMWDRVIAVTLSSVFYASRAALPHLMKTKGCIVTNASVSGLFGDVGFAAYNAAKGGVVNLTRAMAIDHAPDGVRINSVCPGVTDTGLTQWMRDKDEIMKAFSSLPMGRWGAPEEIAAAMVFLASDKASYITGENLVVDGGLTAATGQPAFRRLTDSTD